MKFIDYEYADYNYQAFDIGNHFNEFAGGYVFSLFSQPETVRLLMLLHEPDMQSMCIDYDIIDLF